MLFTWERLANEVFEDLVVQVALVHSADLRDLLGALDLAQAQELFKEIAARTLRPRLEPAGTDRGVVGNDLRYLHRPEVTSESVKPGQTVRGQIETTTKRWSERYWGVVGQRIGPLQLRSMHEMQLQVGSRGSHADVQRTRERLLERTGPAIAKVLARTPRLGVDSGVASSVTDRLDPPSRHRTFTPRSVIAGRKDQGGRCASGEGVQVSLSFLTVAVGTRGKPAVGVRSLGVRKEGVFADRPWADPFGESQDEHLVEIEPNR